MLLAFILGMINIPNFLILLGFISTTFTTSDKALKYIDIMYTYSVLIIFVVTLTSIITSVFIVSTMVVSIFFIFIAIVLLLELLIVLFRLLLIMLDWIVLSFLMLFFDLFLINDSS
jgi:hypothetical protein